MWTGEVAGRWRTTATTATGVVVAGRWRTLTTTATGVVVVGSGTATPAPYRGGCHLASPSTASQEAGQAGWVGVVGVVGHGNYGCSPTIVGPSGDI